RRLGDVVGVVHVERLVHHRIEWLPFGRERLEPERPYDLLDRLGDGLEPAIELVVLTRTVDVVEHRKELRDDPGNGSLMVGLAVAIDPALVVDVLRLQPLQVGRTLGELLLDRQLRRRLGIGRRGVRLRWSVLLRLRGCRLLRLGLGRRRGVGLLRAYLLVIGLGHLLSPSLESSSTISASTTSSSALSPEASPGVAPAASPAAACSEYIAAPIF